MVRKLKVGATMAMYVLCISIAMFLLWAPVVAESIHCACAVGGSFDCTRVEENVQDAVYALFNGNCIKDCSTRNCEQAFYTFTTYINSCPLPQSLTTTDYPIGVVKRGYGPICKPCISFGTPQCTGGSTPAITAPPVLTPPQTPVATAPASVAPAAAIPAVPAAAGGVAPVPPAGGVASVPPVAAVGSVAPAGAAGAAPVAAASRPAGAAVPPAVPAANAPLTITRPDGCVCPAPASGPNQPGNLAPGSAPGQPARQIAGALSGATGLTLNFAKLFLVSFFVLTITSVLLIASS